MTSENARERISSGQQKGHTSFGVRERYQSGQETCDGRFTHDSPIGEEGIDGNRALAHVHQTLRNANHE